MAREVVGRLPAPSLRCTVCCLADGMRLEERLVGRATSRPSIQQYYSETNKDILRQARCQRKMENGEEGNEAKQEEEEEGLLG